MSSFKPFAIFANQRMFYMLALGFSSGLPFALSGSTLQAWLTESQISLMAIGFLSLVSFPYNCKFLWAPLLDRFFFPGLGRRRGWILLTQFCLALCFFILSFMHPESQLRNIGWLVLFMTFAAASQDVAIDAYRADILLPEERGLGSAYFIFAYRMAMFVSGGLALVVAHAWGWERTYQLMGLFMLLGMLNAYFAKEPQAATENQEQKARFLIEPFLDLWRRDHILLTTAFVVLYKAGAALAVALMTTFLIKGVGFSLLEIGLASKAVIIVSSILGTFVGGAVLMRLGLYASLFWFGAAQAFSILFFMLLALVGKNFSLMVLTLFVENFCSGMSTAAFMAFLMSLCNSRYSATQFAFLSAIDTLGRLFAGPLAAFLVLQFGWAVFYGWSFLLSLPGLVLLLILVKRVRLEVPLVSYS